MPLELFAGNMRQCINHTEEFIFQLASEVPERYPELTKLWSAFYQDPLITSEQSGRLVHELIELREAVGTSAGLDHCVKRLLPFFSKAYKLSLDIHCRSD